MNILLDLLPKEVEINDKMYTIRTDFRTSILFELLMLDEEIPEEIKFFQALNLYFPNLPPIEDFEEALKKIMWFYGCGKEEKELFFKRNDSSSKVENIYSFEYDDEYIYSAFLSQYEVDLQDIEHLHWWKFKAMFKSLSEGNKIVEIFKYRSINLNTIENKKEREHYRKLKELYKLPTSINKNEEEKRLRIEEALLNGGILNPEIL